MLRNNALEEDRPIRPPSLVEPGNEREPWNSGSDSMEQQPSYDHVHDYFIYDRFNLLTVLRKSEFLDRLRIEKRRTERSKSPLSIIVLSINKGSSHEHRDRIKSLNLLQTTLRETDIIGFIDSGTIGILLTDTDEQGLQHIEQKLHNRKESACFSRTGGTYPNQIFDSLGKEGRVRPDVIPFILEDSIKPPVYKSALKRGIDIVGSIVGLLALSPIMLVTAAAIKISSPGPVIFKQIRLGEKGVPFTFYKFRSMRIGTDDRIHRDYVTNLITGNHDKVNQGDIQKPLYKIKNDPRITWIGRIIRKTSIDELPQLFNVLKGDMSLVGPRPPLSYEAEKYQSWHLRRILKMKPGLTGLWQVEGRSKTSFDQMVRLDVRYINNWSVILDLKIILKTIKVILTDTGAL